MVEVKHCLIVFLMGWCLIFLGCEETPDCFNELEVLNCDELFIDVNSRAESLKTINGNSYEKMVADTIAWRIGYDCYTDNCNVGNGKVSAP